MTTLSAIKHDILFMTEAIVKKSAAILLITVLSSLICNTVASQNQFCEDLIGKHSDGNLPFSSTDDKKKYISCIFKIQNSGFLLDEMECKYDSAKLKIDLAIRGWTYLKDTLNQANLLKYMGYLNGRLGDFEEAKIQIQKAIELYETQIFEEGIMVCKFNLARVFEYQGLMDSAFILSNKVRDFWENKQDKSRVFVTNTYLIHLANLAKKNINIDSFIKDNQTMLTHSDIYWQNELDFYYVTAEYYRSREASVANRFARQYEEAVERRSDSSSEIQLSLYDPGRCR